MENPFRNCLKTYYTFLRCSVHIKLRSAYLMVSRILNLLFVIGFLTKINGYFSFYCIHILILKQNPFQIKTSSTFGENNSGFVKTRFVKPFDEQINYYNIEMNINSHQANENRIRICHWS